MINCTSDAIIYVVCLEYVVLFMYWMCLSSVGMYTECFGNWNSASALQHWQRMDSRATWCTASERGYIV